MKILYLCGLYTETLVPIFHRFIRHGRLQDAANIYQTAVMEGLAENHADFHVLSFPFLPCYPHNFTNMMVPGEPVMFNGRTVGKSVSYSSLLLYKPLSIMSKVRRHVQDWINAEVKDNEPFTVLTYSYEYFFLEPLISLKRKCPNMRVVSIITDISDDAMAFNSNRSFLKKIQMHFAGKRMRNCLKGIDRFVLLTPHMTELISEASGKNIVVEGIYGNSDNITSDSRLSKSLLYTGTFQEFAGIRLLIDAFMKTTDPDFRLILCGSGPCTEYIEACAKKDSRIDLRGRVTREEAVRLQKSATLLVNPRRPGGGITRYSFPSKTMEYMSSGTPMIGYRLEGIPDEYFEYMIIPDGLTENDLARTIEHWLSLDDDVLHSKGSSARDFILLNKTAKAQVKKIIDFIAVN